MKAILHETLGYSDEEEDIKKLSKKILEHMLCDGRSSGIGIALGVTWIGMVHFSSSHKMCDVVVCCTEYRDRFGKCT